MSESRILVTVSTPWAGEKRFATVRDLAQRLEASVIIAHVTRPTEQPQATRDARRRGERTLSTLTDRLIEAQISAQSVLLFGADIPRAIVNTAQAHQATLIAVSLSGKGPLARLFAGNIPRRVVKHARRPVLLLPADWSGTV